MLSFTVRKWGCSKSHFGCYACTMQGNQNMLRERQDAIWTKFTRNHEEEERR
jgi:hypothetical protein